MSLARRVLEKWLLVGVARHDVAELDTAPSALDALERMHAIVLPESFRQVWTLSDGTAAMDDDEFIFWPLDNITSDPSLGTARGIVTFADWRLQAKYFCLHFAEQRAGEVIDEAGLSVAASFEEFLERYLIDPKGLLVRPTS